MGTVIKVSSLLQPRRTRIGESQGWLMCSKVCDRIVKVFWNEATNCFQQSKSERHDTFNIHPEEKRGGSTKT